MVIDNYSNHISNKELWMTLKLVDDEGQKKLQLIKQNIAGIL